MNTLKIGDFNLPALRIFRSCLLAGGLALGPFAQAGLVITPTFDGSITNDPNAATIISTINDTIRLYETRFGDPIQVRIKFEKMTTGLGHSQWWFISIPYSQYRSALVADARTTNDAIALAHLPAGSINPVTPSSNVSVKSANLRAIGLPGTSGLPGGYDGVIGLNLSLMNVSRSTIDPFKFDLVAVAAHEIDEVLGLASALPSPSFNSPLPEDLFRFDSSGRRSFTTSGDDAYFSIDGGETFLARFNQTSGGDYGDWWSIGLHEPQVQDAFLARGATPDLETELTALDVIGYDLLPHEGLVPDPGLNAAIRAVLQKPAGPLTEQDLLGLTNLDASNRRVRSLQDLEAARNLTTLSLQSNRLTKLSFPGQLTNLSELNLSFNPLTNCILADGLTNLHRLLITSSQLTNFSLPGDLTTLTELDLHNNQLTRFNLPSSLTRLGALNLTLNRLTNFSIPTNLAELNNLNLSANQLFSFDLPPNVANLFFLDLRNNSITNCTLPGGLTELDTLVLSGNRLTALTLPAGLTRLLTLRLGFNELTSFTLPTDTTNLTTLELFDNQLTNLTLPPSLQRLDNLDASFNQFASLTLPAGLTHLRLLNFNQNQLTNVTLPADLNKLNQLELRNNLLTSLELPSGLTNLGFLGLDDNLLTNLVLSSDLENLTGLFLGNNPLTTLTLPPAVTNLRGLLLNGVPLTTLVLPEPLAATNLVFLIGSLRDQGVQVFTYPLRIEMTSPRTMAGGGFELTVNGPPGIYSILASPDLSVWSDLGTLTNQLGNARFSDYTASLSSRKFYRARAIPQPDRQGANGVAH
jgi:internalin A